MGCVLLLYKTRCYQIILLDEIKLGVTTYKREIALNQSWIIKKNIDNIHAIMWNRKSIEFDTFIIRARRVLC